MASSPARLKDTPTVGGTPDARTTLSRPVEEWSIAKPSPLTRKVRCLADEGETEYG